MISVNSSKYFKERFSVSGNARLPVVHRHRRFDFIIRSVHGNALTPILTPFPPSHNVSLKSQSLRMRTLIPKSLLTRIGN